MANLLSWLTDGIGSDGGGSNPMGDMSNGPTPGTMPPPMPQDMDPMTAGGAPPNGPGLPPPPVPMPMARPPGADSGAPPPMPPPMPMARPPGADQGALPPNATPTAGMPPGTPLPLGPGPGVGAPEPASSAPGGGGPGFIGRALGLDANKERSMFGSIGAGLTAAGNSKGKGKGQALFSGAGGAIEGGLKVDKELVDEQHKYIKDNIAALQAGDLGKLNIARTRLALAQAKAAEEGKDTKNSVLNSREQLYFKAIGATNQDAGIKISASNVKAIQTQFGADSKEAKAAMAEHKKLITSVRDGHLREAKVDPATVKDLENKPGFSFETPVPKAGLTQQKFDALPVGSYFINPKDDRVLIKQPPAGANQTPQAQSPTPAAPVPVTAPAGSLADQENDD